MNAVQAVITKITNNRHIGGFIQSSDTSTIRRIHIGLPLNITHMCYVLSVATGPIQFSYATRKK